MSDIRVEETIIVKLSKKKCDYKVIKPNRTWNAFRTLLKARDIWNWYNNGEEKVERLNKKETVNVFGTDNKREESDTTSSGFSEV